MGRETYETVIKLNTEQARRGIDELQQKTEKLKKEQQNWDPGSAKFKNLQKEIDKNNSKMDAMRSRFDSINQALRGMSTAKPKELRDTIKRINELMASGEIARGSKEWDELTNAMKRANTELAKIKMEAKASQSTWSKFTKFLNDSWGGLTLLIGSITGFGMTVRKTVDDYAKMEEEMANVRKYTGMTDEAVRDLNEEFKKMDTRTSREDLNKLAGAAGRLGKDSKEDIMEFVEAADMIGVALGDDLGDDAVDKIGKLAMAFGEDEEKGLKQAMLSTGSAVNELAQNSSAKAGYLVDFTARVAGFGKQLGLTQAQIMGFGAVMDENMLRDEMSATAFGNMLTKMQTDTAKFAKIAGKDVKEFTDLLNTDANAAILALADNLKKADPQTMMKMLDDMGLDGARAVGVLSTMADKIDDVRARQELATKAYNDATSVGDEFNRMNETVEAQIEKNKKKFHEVSVELGKQLLPVVNYTISGGSLFIKVLSALVTVLSKSTATITTVSLALAGLTAYRKWDIIVNKLQIFWNDKLVASYKNMIAVIKGNPWSAAIVGASLLVGVLIDLIRHSSKAAEKQRELTAAEKEQKAVAESVEAVKKDASKSTAEEITKLKLLRKTLEDNTKKYDERKKALDEIKSMVPEYHGQLTQENKLINSNTSALDDYVNSLKAAATAQAAFNKLVKLQEDSISHDELLQKREGNKKWAEQKLAGMGVTENTQFRKNKRWGYSVLDEEGNVVRKISTEEMVQIRHYKDLIKYNKERIAEEKEILSINEKQSDALEEIIEKNKPKTAKGPTKTTYTTDADRKKQEAERRKQEAEERKRLKEAADAAKAESDAKIAAKTHEYAMGKIAYREYIEDMAKLQLEGLKKRRDVYKKGTAEYEKLNRQIEELSFKGDQKVNQLKLEDLRRIMLQQQAEVEAMAAREEITEEDKAERLRTINEIFLADKVELYKKGSKERMDAEWELEQTEQRNKTERERRYQQQLDQIRTQYLGISNDKQLKIALEGLEKLHKQGLLKEEEYQRALIGIQAQYANAKTPKEQEKATANDMVTNAENRAKKYSQFSGYDNSSLPIVSTIQNYKALMENLDILYKDDKENHDAYLLAKQQATAQFCEQLASEMQAAYSSINSIVSAASSYAQACSDLEVARITKNYDKQIAAAGKNEKKREKLEQQKEKAIAKAKNEANQKAMKMEIAQAIASTALAAINAYASASETYWLLGPIAAAMATAAGAIQIAAIQKQHEAQAEGYYGGGFTGGKKYHKEAGVVHEGEFVANHQAVNNPNVLPMLQFLDRAQRNNTVGSLTADDISRQLGQGGGATVVAPVVNVNNDHEELRETLDRASDTIERLSQQIDDGIETYTVVEGPKGSRHQLEVYDSLIKNTKKP